MGQGVFLNANGCDFCTVELFNVCLIKDGESVCRCVVLYVP